MSSQNAIVPYLEAVKSIREHNVVSDFAETNEKPMLY